MARKPVNPNEDIEQELTRSPRPGPPPVFSPETLTRKQRLAIQRRGVWIPPGTPGMGAGFTGGFFNPARIAGTVPESAGAVEPGFFPGRREAEATAAAAAQEDARLQAMRREQEETRAQMRYESEVRQEQFDWEQRAARQRSLGALVTMLPGFQAIEEAGPRPLTLEERQQGFQQGGELAGARRAIAPTGVQPEAEERFAAFQRRVKENPSMVTPVTTEEKEFMERIQTEQQAEQEQRAAAEQQAQVKQFQELQKIAKGELEIKTAQVELQAKALDLAQKTEQQLQIAGMEDMLANAAEQSIAAGQPEAAIRTTPPETMKAVLEGIGATPETQKAVAAQQAVDKAGGALGIARKLIGKDIPVLGSTTVEIDKHRPALNALLEAEPGLTLPEAANRVFKDYVSGKTLTEAEQTKAASAIGLLVRETLEEQTRPALREVMEKQTAQRQAAGVAYAQVGASMAAQQKNPDQAFANVMNDVTGFLWHFNTQLARYSTPDKRQQLLTGLRETAGVFAAIQAKPDISIDEMDDLLKVYLLGKYQDNPGVQRQINGQFTALRAGGQVAPEFAGMREQFQTVMLQGKKNVEVERDRIRKENAKNGLSTVFAEGSANVDATFSNEDDARRYTQAGTSEKLAMKEEERIENQRRLKSALVAGEYQESLDKGAGWVSTIEEGQLHSQIVALETQLGSMTERERRFPGGPEKVAILEKNITALKNQLTFRRGKYIPERTMAEKTPVDRLATLQDMDLAIVGDSRLTPGERQRLHDQLALKINEAAKEAYKAKKADPSVAPEDLKKIWKSAMETQPRQPQPPTAPQPPAAPARGESPGPDWQAAKKRDGSPIWARETKDGRWEAVPRLEAEEPK